MLIALFSSRSITKRHLGFPQRYVRFHSGMSCRRPQPQQSWLVWRSSIRSSFFPAC